MEVEPIYCAEQIVVPENLSDVLKAYTKEVIRHQPDNLLKFSAVYFANLASMSQGLSTIEPPTKEKIQAVYASLPSHDPLPLTKMIELCTQAEIPSNTLEKVTQLGDFKLAETVSPKQFLVLLLTMTGKSLPSIVNSLFEVFGEGGKLEADDFLILFGYVAALDSNLSSALMEELTKSVESTSFLTYSSLGGIDALKDILAVI